MGSGPGPGVFFVNGEFENLAPLRLPCPDCIGASDASCSGCAGTGFVRAPWVDPMIELLEKEGFVKRIS